MLRTLIAGRIRRRLTDGAERGDQGAALVLVVGSMLVLAMLALTALAYTMAGQKMARYDQDYSAAMSAAQSGVDDYISRLNRADNYFSSLDCTNVALQGPTTVANGCGWTGATPIGWLPVDVAATGDKDAFFHYSVDTTKVDTESTVLLQVTGRANGEVRTVEAAVGKGGSTDYVYYTDFESADPSNVQAYSSTPAAACGGNGYDAAKYWWEGRSSANCSEIQFASGDTLEGAVFSNDSVLANNPTFKAGFKTANPECNSSTVTSNQSTWKYCLRKDGGSYSTANFNNVKPAYSTALYLDDTSAAFASYPGCHYYGSTRIVLNADGTMTVWNPTTNNGGQPPTAIGTAGYATPTCGDLTQLNSSGGATVAVPNDMVIYVAAAPTTVARKQCYSKQLGGPSGYELPLGTYASTTPVTPTSSTSYTFDVNMAEATKYCAEGNLYLEGVLNGRVTAAAAQSIIVTGDIVLADGLASSSSDILGLVATNSVEAFHPWMGTVSSSKINSNCNNNCTWKWGTVSTSGSTNVSGWPRQYNDPTVVPQVAGLQIMGSIQTLQHSFFVQQYKVGASLGRLQVNGSIAQRWRGIVGTGSGSTSDTGYLKMYVYDLRLKNSAPPYFPRWINAQWSQRYFGEVNTPASLR